MDAVNLIINPVLNHLVQALIDPISGKPCCRKQVGFRKSLSIGFGAKVIHQNPKTRDKYYGEWEIGTFNSAWRVIRAGKILCASNDPVDSIKELDAAINQIDFSNFVSVQQLTDVDVRVLFDHDMVIDFLAAASDDDEMFHIFCPERKYLEFTIRKGWTIGESNTPWGNRG